MVKKIALMVMMVACGYNIVAWEVISEERGFTLQSVRLSINVHDGMITGIQDKKDEIRYGNNTAMNFPAGIGILRDLNLFRRGHVPWGDPAMKQTLPTDFSLINYFRPCDKSQFHITQSPKQVSAVWKGLSNGTEFLAEAELEMILSEDKSGALECRINGTYPNGGIFGAVLPLVGLKPEGKLVVPGFGGIFYPADGEPALMPFGGAPFMEAPILLMEQGKKSLALWLEDPDMRSFYGFVRRGKDGCAMALEVLTLMPFEGKKSVSTPIFKLDIFNGGWKSAATPLKEWYHTQFKQELAVRDAVPWVEGIKNIVDIYMYTPDNQVLAKIGQLFPKESILFQNWNARAPRFDRELPDWTPREGYVDGVARIHQHGFKTMAYTNTYCVNYLSPVWKHDHLEKFVLTRKNRASRYQGQSTPSSDVVSDKLIGTVDYSDGPDQFAGIEPGKLIYTDPLSQGWREYHARQMVEWKSVTGTDANYEDTAGTAGDHGNGVIDGLSAGLGAVAQMRLLQQIQPQVPMSSEYGPAPIAFATSWALNYASAWGNEEFRRYRTNCQYPLTAYLYGYRQWVTALRGTDDLNCHVMAAVSDATGGLGFFSEGFFHNKTNQEILADYSWHGHFLHRSLIFTRKNLKPYFPEGDYAENIRCMYQGSDGIYSYYDNGVFQQMLDHQGETLYGRVHGTDRVRTSLWLADWPLQNGDEIFGLDPARHYPLFLRPEKVKAEPVSMNSIPDKVVLSEYRTGDGYAYLEFTALPGGPKEVTLTLKHNDTFCYFFANDIEVTAENIRGTLPLRVVCSGKQNSSSNLIKRQAKNFRGHSLYLHNRGSLDFIFHITESDQALELYFRNLQEKYPHHGYDGSIVRLLINGKEVFSYDCLPEPGKIEPDTQLRRWIVPVGAYAGKPILVSVVTDFKKQPVQDRQFVSAPVLFRDVSQKFKEDILDDQLAVKEVIATPTRWTGGPVEVTDNMLTIKGSGTRFAQGIIEVDNKKIYRLSGQFRASREAKDGRVYLGLVPLDENGLKIMPIEVNPLSGTETELTEDVAAGAMEITIKDSSNWKSGKYLGVAFNAKDDQSDLPNRTIIDMAKIEGNKIILQKPLDKKYPAGTKIRQHRSGNTFIYVASLKVPSDQWIDLKGEISGESLSGTPSSQWWQGTRQARIVVVSTQSDIMLQNVRLEELE